MDCPEDKSSKPTFGDIMKGTAVMPPSYKDGDVWLRTTDIPLSDCTEENAVIEKATLCKGNYQETIVSLRLSIKLGKSSGCGWEFASMQDIQVLFNQSKAREMSELVGTPMLVHSQGNAIVGLEVNKDLVL